MLSINYCTAWDLVNTGRISAMQIGRRWKLRDECLNEHWFETLPQARVIIANWRLDYNEVRPHSSCGRMPPAKFASLHRQSR